MASAALAEVACGCTRHSFKVRRALDDEDERRKCLADKGWARRSVVIRGVSGSGAANLEELPGREDYPAGGDGDADWAEAILRFEEENFEGAGTEVRSMASLSNGVPTRSTAVFMS